MARPKLKAVPTVETVTTAPALSEAEQQLQALIIRAAELERLLKPFNALKRERDQIKDKLLAISKSGRNEPLTAPGLLVTFSTREMPAYSVDAHTQNLMHIQHLVHAQ